jgi:hypothetical protein
LETQETSLGSEVRLGGEGVERGKVGRNGSNNLCTCK